MIKFCICNFIFKPFEANQLTCGIKYQLKYGIYSRHFKGFYTVIVQILPFFVYNLCSLIIILLSKEQPYIEKIDFALYLYIPCQVVYIQTKCIPRSTRDTTNGEIDGRFPVAPAHQTINDLQNTILENPIHVYRYLIYKYISGYNDHSIPDRSLSLS